MTAAVVRFPLRFFHAIWITREDTAWLVLARAHGWPFGSLAEARGAARWLSHNLSLSVRELA
jgi:hypothetical protein